MVNSSWVEKSKNARLLEKELLLQPVWEFVGSVQKPIELALDASLFPEGEVKEECKPLLEAKSDRLLVLEQRDIRDPSIMIQESLRSHWTVRTERSELRRKESWLVCGEQARVDSLASRKKKKEDAFTKLDLAIKALKQECGMATGPELLKKRRELGEKQKKLKEKRGSLANEKGTPICLRRFYEEVALPLVELR